MSGSKQLRTFLFLRSQDWTVEAAAEEAGLGLAEAKLTEADRQRGLLDSIEPLNPAAGNAALPKGADMAKKAKAGEDQRGVTNLTNAKEMVRNTVPKIINLKKDRTAINEEISSLRANVEAAGVPKKALDHAIKMMEMDPQDRERFDEGYAIARDAIGLRMSASLFDFIEEPAGENGAGGSDALVAARQHLNGDSARVPDAVA